jgi:hypothetical protein
MRKLSLQFNGNTLDDFYSNFRALFFVLREEDAFKKNTSF